MRPPQRSQSTTLPIQNEQHQEKFMKICAIQQPTKKLSELAKLLAPINKC